MLEILFQLSFPLPDGLEVESLTGDALHHWAELSEDENDDPSIEDVRLMEAIQAELDEFSKSTGVGIQKH